LKENCGKASEKAKLQKSEKQIQMKNFGGFFFSIKKEGQITKTATTIQFKKKGKLKLPNNFYTKLLSKSANFKCKT